MENREQILRKLSRKDNIMDLMAGYGACPSREDLEQYQDILDEIWFGLNSSSECEGNKVRSLYMAMILPYLDRIHRKISDMILVDIDIDNVMKSIREYYGYQVGILSDSVIKCSMDKYFQMNSEFAKEDKNELLELRFVEALREDKTMFNSIFLAFSYWTSCVFKFLEKTTSYLIEVFSNMENEATDIANILAEKELRIRDIQLEVGDRHDDKFVLKFVTATGDLFYKPRNNDVEVSLEYIMKCIGKLDKQVLNIEFPKAHSVDEHQWVKAVSYVPLKDKGEEERYYYRLGEILALYYILDGNDLHFENIISNGEYPVLIDTETVFTSRMLLKIRGKSAYLMEDGNNYGIISVKDIGIVPSYIRVGEVSLDISPINFSSDDREQYRRYNIDKTKLHIACQFISEKELEEQLISGFTKIYRSIEMNRDVIVPKIREAALGLKVRFLKHPTNDYAKIKRVMMKPICYYDYAYAFAASARVYGDGKTPGSIELQEQKDLLELNIPRFEIKVEGKDVFCKNQGTIKDYFFESPWEIVYKKMYYLGDDDYDNQCKIIRMLFASKRGLKLQEPEYYLNDVGDMCETDNIPSKAELENTYHRLVGKVIKDIQHNPINGEPYFLGYQLLGDKYQVLTIPNNYYSGMLGLVDIICKDEDYKARDDMSCLLKDCTKFVKNKIQQVGDEVLTGIYDGLGMYIRIIYRLFKADLMECEEYMSLMKRTLELCRKAVWNDQKKDVLNGNAGLLLGLVEILDINVNDELNIALQDVIKETLDAMNKAVIKANEEYYFPADGFPEVFFTGFGHGSAGCITAMYKAMKRIGYGDIGLIDKLLQTERKYYNAEEGIWYKDNRRDSSSWGWCHGIPGILLSRVELWKEGYRDDRIMSEMDELITLSIAKGLGHNVTFCHGDIGVIAILEYAYEVFEYDERWDYIKEYKQKLIKNVLLKEDERKVRGMESMGLMDGLLGIAYFIKCELEHKSCIDVLNAKV